MHLYIFVCFQVEFHKRLYLRQIFLFHLSIYLWDQRRKILQQILNYLVSNFIQDRSGYIANFNDKNYEDWLDSMADEDAAAFFAEEDEAMVSAMTEALPPLVFAETLSLIVLQWFHEASEVPLDPKSPKIDLFDQNG